MKTALHLPSWPVRVQGSLCRQECQLLVRSNLSCFPEMDLVALCEYPCEMKCYARSVLCRLQRSVWQILPPNFLFLMHARLVQQKLCNPGLHLGNTEGLCTISLSPFILTPCILDYIKTKGSTERHFCLDLTTVEKLLNLAYKMWAAIICCSRDTMANLQRSRSRSVSANLHDSMVRN